ncbi:MAG: hypothetical protein SFX73_15875 [Kofleriaceae bacterium]|nr:hypothetical protein [Kofleriaceae bacterium]
MNGDAAIARGRPARGTDDCPDRGGEAEVTFLDELYVEVDGIRVEPPSCKGVPAPALGVADDKHHVLREGDTLDLVFEVSGAAARFASGQYIPTLTAAHRSTDAAWVGPTVPPPFSAAASNGDSR